MRVGENIRDMRKRVMLQLENQKIFEQAKKTALRRKGQSLGGGISSSRLAPVPSASESRKHMKVISVSRTGLYPSSN